MIGPLMDRYRRYASPRAPPGCSDLATKQAPSPRKAPEKQPTRPTGHSVSSTLASREPSRPLAKRPPTLVVLLLNRGVAFLQHVDRMTHHFLRRAGHEVRLRGLLATLIEPLLIGEIALHEIAFAVSTTETPRRLDATSSISHAASLSKKPFLYSRPPFEPIIRGTYLYGEEGKE